MARKEEATQLESLTIQPIPLEERHGTARDLFTVWFGSNVMLLTIVTGGLAISDFKLSFIWASIGLTVGNLVGAIFMALHAAQGPRLGVPQMVQTRGQFGSYGSLLVVGIVIIMYVGFLASNLVSGGEAIASITTGISDVPGIVLVGVLSVVAAIFGYDLIHAYARVMTYLAGAVITLAAIWIFCVHGVPANFLTRNGYSTQGMLGAISIAALWQIAYAPYVSDYSRYMPADTGAKPAFWASYWGCAIGSLLPMILGAAVATATPEKQGIVAGLAALTHGVAPLVIIVLAVGVAAANAINLYCGALSTLTIGQTLLPHWSPGSMARAVTATILFGMSLLAALLGKDSFVVNYTDFILLLLYVLVPWTAINLVDYYILRHGEYDVASFLRRDGGIYGRVNIVAVLCYLLGIVVQLPFVATPMYTGPVARAIGGADLSWVVGLLITSPVYVLLARAFPGAAGNLGAQVPRR